MGVAVLSLSNPSFTGEPATVVDQTIDHVRFFLGEKEAVILRPASRPQQRCAVDGDRPRALARISFRLIGASGLGPREAGVVKLLACSRRVRKSGPTSKQQVMLHIAA